MTKIKDSLVTEVKNINQTAHDIKDTAKKGALDVWNEAKNTFNNTQKVNQTAQETKEKVLQ